MPQKIRLRDLDPSLVALLAGGEIGEGQLNNILSRYRKKSEVIVEQDIDPVYRNALYGLIDEVKNKLEKHLAQALVVAEKDLDPQLLQKIKSLESKIIGLGNGKDFSTDIQNIQDDIQELHNIIDAFDIETLSNTLTTLSSDMNAVESSIQQLITLNGTLRNDITSLNSSLADKRDKDTPITEDDLDTATAEKLNKSAEALAKAQELANTIDAAIASKRDKSDLITESDLDPLVVNKIGQGTQALTKTQELADSLKTGLESKRDKAVPIAETDLDSALVNKINSAASSVGDSISSLASEINLKLANKRDKSDPISEIDLSDSVKKQLANILNLDQAVSNLTTTVENGLDAKRDKNVPIKIADLEAGISDSINKITPLINRFNSFEDDVKNSLNSKRSKDELIVENDLSSALVDKLNRGTSAYDSVSDLKSRMNTFPQVEPGDYLSVSYAGGSVSGKKLFTPMLTVADESDVAALKSNDDVEEVFVRSTNKVFTREKEKGSSSSGDSNLVVQDDFFSIDVSSWNTFIVDSATKVIVAYVLSGGQVLRFNVKEQRKATTIGAGASIRFVCGNAMSVPVRVLAKMSDGKYTPADGVVSVLYETGAYTLRNESDEQLNIIIIEG